MHDDLSGEKFLNRLYKDLNQSDIVKHTAKGAKNKDEAKEAIIKVQKGSLDKWLNFLNNKIKI